MSDTDLLREELIDRWDLRRYFGHKTLCGPPFGTWHEQYGEVPPATLVTLLPHALLDQLVMSELDVRYDNAARRSRFDPATCTITLKSTHTFLHELGHALWYLQIIDAEREQRDRVVASRAGGRRPWLPDRLLPTLHKVYGRLVGAATGQFLTDAYLDVDDDAPDPTGPPLPLGPPPAPRYDRYANDLEEHFARNVSRLLLGRPLYVLPGARSVLDALLALFRVTRIIDADHEAFYRLHLSTFYLAPRELPRREQPVVTLDPTAGVLIPEALGRAAVGAEPLDEYLSELDLRRINATREAVGLDPVPLGDEQSRARFVALCRAASSERCPS